MTSRRDALPNRRNQISFDFRRSGVRFVGSVGFFDDGRPAEVFVQCERASTEIAALGRDAAILISLGLQHGVTLDTMRHGVTRDHDEEPSSFVGALLDEVDKLLRDRGEEGAMAPSSPPSPRPHAEALA